MHCGRVKLSNLQNDLQAHFAHIADLQGPGTRTCLGYQIRPYFQDRVFAKSRALLNPNCLYTLRRHWQTSWVSQHRLS